MTKGAPSPARQDQPIRRATIAAGKIKPNGASAAANPAGVRETSPNTAIQMSSVRKAQSPSANGALNSKVAKEFFSMILIMLQTLVPQ